MYIFSIYTFNPLSIIYKEGKENGIKIAKKQKILREYKFSSYQDFLERSIESAIIDLFVSQNISRI